MKKTYWTIHISIFFLTIVAIFISTLTSPRVVSLTFASETKGTINILDQQIRITFSRPMDQKSTQEAFSLEPKVKGDTSWVNNTFYFTPSQPLKYDQTYTIRMQDRAKDIYGKKLNRTYIKSFYTKGASFAFIGIDKQLHISDFKGNTQTITKGRGVLDYQIHNGMIVYIQENSDDTNNIYMYDPLTRQSKSLLSDTQNWYSQIQLSRDGTVLYWLPSSSSYGELMGHTLLSYTLGAHKSFIENDVNHIGLSIIMGQVSRFWLLPDGNTLLLQNYDDEFFFHTISDNQNTLLGKYTDFGGSDGNSDKLVYSTIYASGVPVIILYDGKNTQISDPGENATLPSISYDGKLLGYSFQDATATDQKLNIKLIDLSAKKIVLKKTDPRLSLERPKISSDNQFLAFEEYDVSHHIISPYNIHPDVNERPLLRIINIASGIPLPLNLQGTYFQWIE